MMIEQCPECGAPWSAEETCQVYFHQMLFWENEDPARGEVHHLMVLCYHLQHPSLYSAKGLAEGRWLLAEFVEKRTRPEDVRRKYSERVNSGNRPWKVTARPGDRGSYNRPIDWTMTAADVVSGGVERYCENVRLWSHTIHTSLTRAFIANE